MSNRSYSNKLLILASHQISEGIMFKIFLGGMLSEVIKLKMEIQDGDTLIEQSP